MLLHATVGTTMFTMRMIFSSMYMRQETNNHEIYPVKYNLRCNMYHVMEKST